MLTVTASVAGPVGAAELTAQDIRAYYAAWSAGDLDRVMGYFTDDVVYEDVATGEVSTGKAEVRAFARKFLDGTPGVKVEPTNVVVGDDAAAVEWTMSAGSGDEAWSVRGAAFIEHIDGKITRATDYWDAE